MDLSTYLRTLLSVWVGLGLGQLVQALHRLAHRYFFSLWAAVLFLAIVVSVLVRGRLIGADAFRLVALGAAIALASSAE